MRLELTSGEVCMVINALDFYSRICIGQYDEINNLLRLYDHEACEEDYLKLRSILIPTLASEKFNCSLGIWNAETDSMAKSAYVCSR